MATSWAAEKAREGAAAGAAPSPSVMAGPGQPLSDADAQHRRANGKAGKR